MMPWIPLSLHPNPRSVFYLGYAVESRLEDAERAARYLERYKSLLSEPDRRD